MKTYCFNYMVEGERTFLPIFICVETTNQIKAFRIAKKYLKENNNGEIKIWFKNFPDLVDKPFQSKRVPKEFYQ